MTHIAVHDYGGYPFILELSRELARRGHVVLHLYPSGFRTPRGPVQSRSDDAPSLSIRGVELAERPYRSGVRRLLQERRYGDRLEGVIRTFKPDVVLSANTPVGVQLRACRTAHEQGAAFVFWLQDVYSAAVTRILSRRNGILGTVAGAPFRLAERNALRFADAVVPISDAFLPVLESWRITGEKITVIENWAPLEDDNRLSGSWASDHGLTGRPVLLYAGTLALKHNPALLLALAAGIPHAWVAVVSEGPGADWLKDHAVASTPNLRVLPFEPYDRVNSMLASADVLIAVLEPDASTFSAPSKVLTYLAAGKPILAAMPSGNPIAQIIAATGAGRVVDPRDPHELVAAAHDLLRDRSGLTAMGTAGRRYAEAHFRIDLIGDRFEALIEAAIRRRSGAGGPEGADRVSASDTRDRMEP